MRIACFAAFLTAAFTSPVCACDKDPFLFLLPGETVENAKDRSARIGSDYRVVRRYNREKFAFEQATAIFLGQVVSSGETTYKNLPWKVPTTEVQPVTPLKGSLPAANLKLIDEAQSGACTDWGDGHGAWAKDGDLVVVFVGLPRSQERPNGIDSFAPNDIRTIELLDALRAYGKDIENEVG